VHTVKTKKSVSLTSRSGEGISFFTKDTIIMIQKSLKMIKKAPTCTLEFG